MTTCQKKVIVHLLQLDVRRQTDSIGESQLGISVTTVVFTILLLYSTIVCNCSCNDLVTRKRDLKRRLALMT
jgi:hypothetical protein